MEQHLVAKNNNFRERLEMGFKFPKKCNLLLRGKALKMYNFFTFRQFMIFNKLADSLPQTVVFMLIDQETHNN